MSLFLFLILSLWERCESKCVHPGHDMIRISSPTNIYPKTFFEQIARSVPVHIYGNLRNKSILPEISECIVRYQTARMRLWTWT